MLDRPADPANNPYYATRYAPDRHRSRVWAYLTAYLARWIPSTGDVLELGAGYCDFINSVQAGTRTAMDVDIELPSRTDLGVRSEIGDCADLSRFDDSSFDVVFASNLVEHLTREAGMRLAVESRRVLRPGGRIILMQPNYRLRPGEYFDDYTHLSVYSDRSLPDMLAASGFAVVAVKARFLPLSMKSRFSALTWLVPLYLRSPVRPMAGQMLVVAEKPR